MEATHPRTIFSRYSTKRCLHLHISFIKLQLSFTRNLSLYRRVTSPFNRSERTQTAASLKSSYKWEKSCGNHQAQSTPREQVMLLILIFPSKKNYLKFTKKKIEKILQWVCFSFLIHFDQLSCNILMLFVIYLILT